MPVSYERYDTQKRFSLFLPYISIGFGLYGCHSAWVAILLYHVGMLHFMVFNHYKAAFRKLYKKWKKIWALLIPFSALSGITIYFLWPWIQGHLDLNIQLERYGLVGWKWTAFLFYYSLFHPFLEQLFWRGYLGHPSKQLRIEDIAFSGYHFFTMILFVQWPWALLSWSVLAGVAWLWRQCVRETGGLLIPMLSHFIADVSVIWMVNALL